MLSRLTLESVVSAEDESDKDLIEVDVARPRPSPPCFRSASALPLEGVGVLLRDGAWLWGGGFLSFLKGSSIIVGPPGTLGGPLEKVETFETRGWVGPLTPFLATGRPRPPSMDWILRSCAGSSFYKK